MSCVIIAVFTGYSQYYSDRSCRNLCSISSSTATSRQVSSDIISFYCKCNGSKSVFSESCIKSSYLFYSIRTRRCNGNYITWTFSYYTANRLEHMRRYLCSAPTTAILLPTVVTTITIVAVTVATYKT